MTDRRYLAGGLCSNLLNPMTKISTMYISYILGAAIKMDHFQPAVDPRKQELLEARFLGARVNNFTHLCFPYKLMRSYKKLIQRLLVLHSKMFEGVVLYFSVYVHQDSF